MKVVQQLEVLLMATLEEEAISAMLVALEEEFKWAIDLLRSTITREIMPAVDNLQQSPLALYHSQAKELESHD